MTGLVSLVGAGPGDPELLTVKAVRRLEEDGALDDLSPELREVAELRLRHPTLSIAELASRCRPPATKAAAYRRLRRLQALADR